MRVIRVLFGFAVGCLAAAATLVLFVYTPAELMNLPSEMRDDRVYEAAFFALVVTPHVATFSALPALIGIAIAELRGIGEWSYYVLLGVGVAVLGFLTQHFTEAPGQVTILHNYALIAFLTSGCVGGFAYWVFSGRYAVRTADGPPQKAGAPPPAGDIAARGA